MGRPKLLKQPDVTFSFKLSNLEKKELVLLITDSLEAVNKELPKTTAKVRANEIVLKSLIEGLRQGLYRTKRVAKKTR